MSNEKEPLINGLENGKIIKHSGSFIAYNREWLFNGNNLEMEFDLLRRTRNATVKSGERMKLDKETLERLRQNSINANEIPIDDEIMQDDKWDEIYESEVEE